MDDISLADAARRLGISPVTLRKAAARGLLPAKKLAGRWFTSSPAVEEYRARRRPRGRPRRKIDR